jgi:23S rRNA pseudouridine2605 synthase
MDFENNEKKQEETQKDDSQKEFRPGRSPRPRIHMGQRPAYEQRPNFRSNTHDEGGFRPEGFGAGLQSNTPQRSFRPRNNYNGGGYGQQRSEGGYQSRPQGGYSQQRSQGGYGQRPQQGGYQQRGG